MTVTLKSAKLREWSCGLAWVALTNMTLYAICPCWFPYSGLVLGIPLGYLGAKLYGKYLDV